MATAPADPHQTHAEAVADAKRLMRLARTGALATLEAERGEPLTTLVGVASDFDGAPLFLMSTLSRHTRNLIRDPRASLLLTGARDRGDPLNHPRVTLGGRVELDPPSGAKSRYLQRNRKAALYAGFADFGMFRLRNRAGAFQRRIRSRRARSPRPTSSLHARARRRWLRRRRGFSPRSMPSAKPWSPGSPDTRPRAPAGGRSASTPRGLTSQPAAAPRGLSSAPRPMTRQPGRRGSGNCWRVDGRRRPRSAGEAVGKERAL